MGFDTDAAEAALLDLGLKAQSAAAAEGSPWAGVAEWYGADVFITSNPMNDRSGPFATKTGVWTQHSIPLSWLFEQARDIFVDFLDAGNKYEFYGRLADRANAHLASHQPESDDYRPLLAETLQEALEMLSEIRADPAWRRQSSVNLVERDEEGRVRRTPLLPPEDES